MRKFIDYLKMQLVRLDMLQFIIYSVSVYVTAMLLPPLISIVILVVLFAMFTVIGDME